jgi:hypothetical protein
MEQIWNTFWSHIYYEAAYSTFLWSVIAVRRWMASCRTYKNMCWYDAASSRANISANDRRMNWTDGNVDGDINLQFLT